MDADLILARQVAVDVPDLLNADADREAFSPAALAQADADIIMGTHAAAWSIQAIAEGIRRGRAEALASYEAELAAAQRRITFLEAAVQPFANAAKVISSFWDDARFILRETDTGRILISYRDVRMAARAMGLPASVEEV